MCFEPAIDFSRRILTEGDEVISASDGPELDSGALLAVGVAEDRSLRAGDLFIEVEVLSGGGLCVAPVVTAPSRDGLRGRGVRRGVGSAQGMATIVGDDVVVATVNLEDGHWL